MKKHYSILLILIGVIGLWLTFSHILHFEYPLYFYNMYPDIKKFVGTNVVSMYADFSYFTYHTIILFSIWCILLGISELFKINKLNNFLRSDGVMTFVFLNYLLTMVLATLFEFISGNPTFGYYGPSKLSIHNLGTNIIAHYILFIICLLCFIFIKTKTKTSKKIYFVITSYLLIYYLVVKLTGMYCYNIEWYPYVIFDSESIGSIIGSKNSIVNIMLLIIINVVIYIVYMVSFILIKNSKTKKRN